MLNINEWFVDLFSLLSLHFNSCDEEYTGINCEISVFNLPTEFNRTFEVFSLEEDPFIPYVRGASLGFKCGVLVSGKALVFDQPGDRDMITTEFNTSTSGWENITFVILIACVCDIFITFYAVLYLSWNIDIDIAKALPVKGYQRLPSTLNRARW